LRAKINNLEKELAETKSQLSEAESKLKILHEFEPSKKSTKDSTRSLESITDELIIKEIKKRDDVIKSQKAYIKKLEAVVLKSRDKPQNSKNQKEPIYKVLVIGDPSVGKAELISKFGVGTLEEELVPTVGVNIVKRPIIIEKDITIINLMFWNVAVQPQFYMLHRPYFNGADAVILTFDITLIQIYIIFYKKE
jgi:hypothetical protein